MTEPKQLRIFFYWRVSTPSQTTDNQVIQLQQVADTRGWRVLRVFTDVASGARDRRPALDEMMKAVRRGQVDLICVVALDRLARNARHLITLVEDFRRAGVGLFSLREGIDSYSATGQMVMTIFAALAEFELSVLRERTVHGLRAARLKGKRLGRPPKNTVDVEQALKLIECGMSKKAVAKMLNVPRTSLLRALVAVSENVSKTEAVSG
jgi:DNA invertase Pin-like site-specific DNA recombinase